MVDSITTKSVIRYSWSNRQCIILAIASLGLGIFIFVMACYGMYTNTGLGSYNQPVLSWMIEHRQTQVIAVMAAVTTAANLQIYGTAVSIMAIIWSIVKHEIWRPLVFTISIAIAAITATEIKLATMNARPSQLFMMAPFELDYSFPSGHTIVVAVCLLVIGYLIYSRHYNIGQFIYWLVITVLGIGLIATSRLYLGYHWFTDIAGSIGLSLIIFALVILVDRLMIGKSGR